MYQNIQALLNALQSIAKPDAATPPASYIAEHTLFEFNDNLARRIRQDLDAARHVTAPKIYAIKLYREHIGGSLREAKDWVENHMAQDV